MTASISPSNNYVIQGNLQKLSSKFIQKRTQCVTSVRQQISRLFGLLLLYKIQPKTVDLTTRLSAITTEFVGFIPQSFIMGNIVLGWILIYRDCSIILKGLHYRAIQTWSPIKPGSLPKWENQNSKGKGWIGFFSYVEWFRSRDLSI